MRKMRLERQARQTREDPRHIRSFEICPKQDGKPLKGWSGGGEL